MTVDDLLSPLTRNFLRFIWKRTNMFPAKLLKMFVSHGGTIALLRDLVLFTDVISTSIPSRTGFLEPPLWDAAGPLPELEQEKYDRLSFCVKELSIKSSDMNDYHRWNTIDRLRYAPKCVFDLLLSEHWADVNTNGRHYTLLSGAAERHDIPQMTYLLQKGARINASDRNDLCSPLHRALGYYPFRSGLSEDTIRFLIGRSAALTVPNYDGLTPEEMARKHYGDHHELVLQIRTTIATRRTEANVETQLALEPSTLWDQTINVQRNPAMLTIAFSHMDAIETRRFLRHPVIVPANLKNNYMAWVCQTIIIWNAIRNSDNEIFNTPAIVNSILGFATGKSPQTTRDHLETARNNAATSFAPEQEDFEPTWMEPSYL